MSQLIEMNGKYYGLTDVVMLPSKDKTISHMQPFLHHDKLMYTTGATVGVSEKEIQIRYCVPQHLYFLSNEDIVEGGWFLTDIRDNIHQNDGNPIWELKQCTHINNGWIFTKEVGVGFNPDWSKNIIATTDPSLNINIPELRPDCEEGIFGGYYYMDKGVAIYITKKDFALKFKSKSKLPEPSHNFIQKYVEFFNVDKPITKVLVEVEKNMAFDTTGRFELFLKVNPDNTISIKSVKDNWSKEELHNIIESFEYDKGVIDYKKLIPALLKEIDYDLSENWLNDEWVKEFL